MLEVFSALSFSKILSILFALNFFGVLITILLENRDPAKSLAYIMILIFIPVLGLIIYYFVGRDLRKRQIFRLKNFKDTEIADKYRDKYFQKSEKALENIEREIGNLSLPFKTLYHQGQSMVHEGNRLSLLKNGEEKFPSLFEALENAKHHIHIEYYIFSKDDVGDRITDILLQKLSEGVEVKLIIDDWGSRKIKDIPERLKTAGAEVFKFMPVQFPSLSQANYRNHRKIIVIDGLIGFVGGINIDDRYLNNGKHKLYWRDTHLKIEGLS